MEICEICGKEFDKSKRFKQNKHNICSKECKNIFLGNINRKHNLAHKTNLYSIWKSLKQRCTNQKNKSYKNYGARGIRVCEEWNDFENFFKWSIENGYRYEPQTSNRNKWSIDRIDNNGNYCPDNCRWTTDDVQSKNKQKSIRDEERNKICVVCGKPFKIIARNKVNKTCSKKCSLIQRSIEYQEKTKDKYKKECIVCHKIFENRSGHFNRVNCCSRECASISNSPIWEFNGRKLRVREWAKELGMTAHCLFHRIEIGWSIEEALTIPKGCKRKDYEKYKL